MRVRIALAFVFVPLVIFAGEPERLQQSIVKGRSATVKLPFTAGAGANSNTDVVQGTVDGKSILLFGRESGEATYTIWSRDKKRSVEIDVVVTDRDVAKVQRELESALSEFEGVTVTLRDGDVIVEGEVATLDELRGVDRIVSRYQGVRSEITGP